jgi:hypothetical protein
MNVSDMAPWECIAPFCALATPDLGFHVIQDEDAGDSSKESSNYALIAIKEGTATTR